MKAILCSAVFLLLNLCVWGQRRPAETIKQPNSIAISKLYRLNSAYREINMNITPDGKYLYFMSSRGGTPWATSRYLVYQGQSQYDGDIWYSTRKGKTWQAPTVLGPNVNSAQGDDEPNISPDGSTVYFQSWHNDKGGWGSDGGPYYKASKVGNSWGKKVGLGGGINRFFGEGQTLGTDGMSISPDGKTFIVAAGPDYNEKMDLYMSTQKNGVWSYPVKLGISTQGDDRSPFIAADGITLYFASDGYEGFGNLDIFKVNLQEAMSGGSPKVYNLGTPFNTIDQDCGFMLTSDGKEAYFIRNGDIHFADVSKSPKEMKPLTTFVLNGTIRNATTKTLLQNSLLQIISTRQQNTRTNSLGEYTTTVSKIKENESLTEVEITVNKRGYEPYRYRLALRLTESSNVITHDILLVPNDDDDTTTAEKLKKQTEERLLKQQALLLRNQEAEKRKIEMIRLEQEKRKKQEQEKLRNQEAACHI